jgi:hypothetical protein
MFADAERKNLQAQNFFNAILKDKAKYRAISQKYKIEIDQDQLVLNAYRCTPAQVLFDGKKTYDLKNLAKE